MKKALIKITRNAMVTIRQIKTLALKLPHKPDRKELGFLRIERFKI
jgi:hypothetical protein